MANGKIEKIVNFSKITLLYADQGYNLNNIHGDNTTGLYYIGADVPNSPIDYATMLVISRDGSNGFASQLVMGNDIYCRVYIGSPPAWSPWRKLN